LPDRLFHLFSHFGNVCILKTLFGIDGSDAFIPFHCTYGLSDIIGRHLHIRDLRAVAGAGVRAVHFKIVGVTGNGNALIRDGLFFPFAVEVPATQAIDLKRQRLFHIRIGKISGGVDDDVQGYLLTILCFNALGRDAFNPADIHIDIVTGQRGKVGV